MSLGHGSRPATAERYSTTIDSNSAPVASVPAFPTTGKHGYETRGGDLGSLAVHGSVNDLAVSGARPTHLSCAALIEEGFPIATLDPRL